MQQQIERRNVAVCIILSIVTCGIYGIIWTVKMIKEAVQVRDPNDSGTAEILLSIFLSFVGTYMAEKKLAEGCAMKGIQHEDRSVVYLVLGLFGFSIVSFALIQSDLNKIADILYGPVMPNQPQQPYGAQPQQPYGAQPQQPYGAQPQQPYGAQPQQPYDAQPQQPYSAQPQQPADPQQPPFQG